MTESLQNLHEDSREREFFVWVRADSALVRHNLSDVGAFFGGPLGEGEDRPENLLFVPNPAARREFLTPFHLGIVRNYSVEYDLERCRHGEFDRYPSRFFAVFLLQDRETAEEYRKAHPDQTRGRVLKRAVTSGSYRFSVHDSSWIDFLREEHAIDRDTMARCARAYWRGERTADRKLRSSGEPWQGTSIPEILFYGRVHFPNRDPSRSD